jgi:hypothetical protein
MSPGVIVGSAAYLVVLGLLLCSNNVLNLGEGVSKVDVNKLQDIISDISSKQRARVDELSMKQ